MGWDTDLSVLHDKMPDVVLYKEDKNWIYFVESVTSVGPMDPKRIIEIESMTANVSAGKKIINEKIRDNS